MKLGDERENLVENSDILLLEYDAFVSQIQNSDLKSKIAQVRESIVLDLLIQKICNKVHIDSYRVNETKKFMIDLSDHRREHFVESDP